MTVPQSLAPANPEEVGVLQQVQQAWVNGNQTQALSMLRERAKKDRVWAIGLLAWLLPQTGLPGLTEGVDWALKAARLGVPGPATNSLNNVFANLVSDPTLASRIPPLLAEGFPWPVGVDVFGQAWNLASQGRADLALQLMELTPVTPVTEPQWASLISDAQQRYDELGKIVQAARSRGAEVDAAAGEAELSIQSAKDGLETTANQAQLLVQSISSDATNSLFEEDAKRNAGESRSAWNWGLRILGLAALVAILPIILHYIGLGPTYSPLEQLGVHLASTAALASFAGVLLARARSRDRAAQHAKDISTAMGTMISYSNQISDPVEKQRFMTSMGQVILQAHLSSGGGAGNSDEAVSSMLGVANLMRNYSQASGPAGTS